ncbi:C6 zinc finger domain-containing protein [Lophiotrema nucula]|uniref:C6 zinc finger domain-containing protein n=1 Tax=Lophiotrema nucula TaxID=690887 RepID=A0A6A5YF43_9PLEO|nr:C6 zinc finger domain-containing protein [Lophiotrema nucula]
MSSLAQGKRTAKDRQKNTKSRNGCGRCKLKRLKCDETSPACLQCKKRNVPCPGYEKTLKWSTKYEVLQPVEFETSIGAPDPPNTAPKAFNVGEILLPPDVVIGFEALAAVLPMGKKRPDFSQSCHSQEKAQSREASPDITDEPRPSTRDSSFEQNGFVRGLDSTSANLFDDLIDPMLLQEKFVDLDALEQDLPHDNFDQFIFDDTTALAEDFEVKDIQRRQDDTSLVEVASPRLSRSLLLDYYRLPGPSASLQDIDSILVQHYFKDVCVLFSAFDSSLNPFRTTIGRLFNESPSIYYGIQSMAAAHLANTFPNMAVVGIEMQRKACESLQAELPLVQSGQASGGRAFLSIILLGLTCCWHESSALGEEFLTTARSLILPKLLSSSEDEAAQRQNQFFEESLIYWEMLMGFVTQDAMSFSPGPAIRSRVSKNSAPAARRPDGKIVPHPWTGIAPTVQILFAEVGRLVRRERMMRASVHLHVNAGLRRENLLNAASLEEDLLAAEYPMADELADPGDERTPKHDFIVIAEAYRCAGLLELYRVFPSVLRKRLGTDRFTWTDNVEFEFPTPRFETPYEDTDTKLWINSLALHILTALETLPSSSGTCCLQPILLVAAASELKNVSSVDYFDIYANDTKVQHARAFVDQRLHQYALRLPAKPIRKCIELVKEVWRRLDSGQDGCFWVDVMVEKGWHTVMG